MLKKPLENTRLQAPAGKVSLSLEQNPTDGIYSDPEIVARPLHRLQPPCPALTEHVTNQPGQRLGGRGSNLFSRASNENE
jgi:hypothetical protein